MPWSGCNPIRLAAIAVCLAAPLSSDFERPAFSGDAAAPAGALSGIIEVPTVFTKPAPAGVDDLRAIESHIRSLVEQLRECTVGVQIGPAQGSGVIVSADGYVLTAAHVSGRPGRPVKLVLADGRRVSATTLGCDETLDAGLIQIDDRDVEWPHAEMADADSVHSGHWCLATGHPGGYHEGRPPVFRLGRVIFATPRVVQTDCELVGGDSGGPLFDMQGHVIGINSRIGDDNEMNFHVPVSAFAKSWDRLMAAEQFRTHSGALLGVSGEPDKAGLRITTVYPDEPAEAAGIEVGDILVTLASRKVTNIEQLTELVGQQPPGRRVKAQVLRKGKQIELTIRLGFRWD